MTGFEQYCWRLGARRAKAEASRFSHWSDRVLAEWEAQANDEVRQALAQGLRAFEQAILDRLLRQYREGTLALNRCPKCRRIVRTPVAKQCLWCGNDWHDA
jgi:hypothetical protein